MKNKINNKFVIVFLIIFLLMIIVFIFSDNRILENKIELEKQTYKEKILEYKNEINKLKNPNIEYSDFKKIIVNKGKIIIKDNLIKKELNGKGFKKLGVEKDSIINEIINKGLNNDFKGTIINYGKYKVKVDKNYKIINFYKGNKEIKDSEIINKYIFEIDDLYKKTDDNKNDIKPSIVVPKNSIIYKIYNNKTIKYDKDFIDIVLLTNKYWNDKNKTFTEKIKLLQNTIIEGEGIVLNVRTDLKKLYIYTGKDEKLIRDFLIGKKYEINNVPYSPYIIKVDIEDSHFITIKGAYVHFKGKFNKFGRKIKNNYTYSEFFIGENHIKEFKDNTIEVISSKQNLWIKILGNFISEYYKGYYEYYNDFINYKEYKKLNDFKIKDFVYNKFYDISLRGNLSEQDLKNFNFKIELAYLGKNYIKKYPGQYLGVEVFWTIFDEYNKKNDILENN